MLISMKSGRGPSEDPVNLSQEDVAQRARRRILAVTFAAAAAMLPVTRSAMAASSTFNGNANGTNSESYSDTTQWAGGVVANGTDSIATINLSNSTGTGSVSGLIINTPVTLGGITLTGSNGGNFNIAGDGTDALTFAVSTTSQPTLEWHSYYSKTYELGSGSSVLNIAGTQGLLIDSGANTVLFSTEDNWGSFSGLLTLAGGCGLDSNGSNTLPDVDLTMGTTGSDGTGQHTVLGMFAGRNQTIGALNGDANSVLNNNSTTGTSTITIGSTNDSGTFAGTIGANSVHSTSGNFGAGQGSINVVKTGSGTETISGNIINASGSAGSTVGVNNGLLILSGSNTYIGATSVSGTGTLQLGSAGALGATSGVSVASGGTLDLNGRSVSASFASIVGSGVGGNGAIINSNTSAGATISGTFNDAGNAFTFGGAGNISVSAISGDASTAITKIGGGSLTFTGTSSYLGATTVNTGQLILNSGSALGDTAVTVNSSLLAKGSATIGTSTANGGSLTLPGGSIFSMVDGSTGNLTVNGTGVGLTVGGTSATSLSFELGAAGTYDSINLANSSTLALAGASTVSVTDLSGVSPGTYNLINFPGGYSGSGTFTLGTVTNPGSYTYSLTPLTSGSTALKLVVTGSALATAYWSGAQGTIWSTQTGSSSPSTNWSATDGGPDVHQIPSGGVTNVFFGATGNSLGTLNSTLGADFSIASLTFNSTRTNSVIIGGANSLTILTGGITIQSGSGAHTISATGDTSAGTPGVVLGTSQTWTNNSANLFTVQSGIGDGGAGNALTIAGTGKILLAGSDSYTGGTTIGSTSTLQLGNASALSSGAVAVAGTLDVNGITTSAAGVLSGAGTVTNTNGSTGSLAVTSGTFSGLIKDGTGTTSLTVAGPGTLTLTNSDTYSAGTSINSGATLQLGDGSTTNGSIVQAVTDNGALTFANVSAQTSSISAAGSGIINANGSATLILTGSNTNAQGLNIQAGTVQAGSATAVNGVPVIVSNTGTFDLNGNTLGIGSLSTNANGSTGAVVTDSGAAATLTVNGSGTYAGKLTGNMALAVTAGTLVIQNDSTGANTYSGGTTIGGTGTLKVGFGANIGATGSSYVNTALGSGPIVVNSGGTLTLNTMPSGGAPAIISQMTNNLTLNGSANLVSAEGENVFENDTVTFNGSGNAITATYPNKPIEFFSNLAGSGSVSINGTTNGFPAKSVRIFNDVNAYNGTITVNAGANGGVQLVTGDDTNLSNATVNIAGNVPAPTGSQVVDLVFNGIGDSALVFDSTTTDPLFVGSDVTAPTLGALSSTSGGDIDLAVPFATGGSPTNEVVNLTIGGNNASTSYAGNISDASVSYSNNNGTLVTTAGSSTGGSVTKIGTGTQTFSGVDTYTGGTNVSMGTLTFASPGALPNFTALTIGANALANAANYGTAAKNNLFVSSLSIAGVSGNWTGKLDLANNDMVVQNGNLAMITNQVAEGYNGGKWNGAGGIVSTVAAADTTHLTALGVILNSSTGLPGGSILYSSFDSATAAASTDVLVKYTYYGDTNLSGTVDGTDYARIDAAYLNNRTGGTPMTGWYNGDFNYDGVIDGSDYTLMDNAFNTQGTQILAQIATPTSEIAGAIGNASSVPEPATLGLFGISAVSLLGRRRRRN